MPNFTFSLTDAEHDAVAVGLPGDPETADARVCEYLGKQLRAVVAQHVTVAERRALVAEGLPDGLRAAGLEEDDIEALRVARAAKRTKAAVEAAKEG